MRQPGLYKKNQRGQAIVLIAALMVALIGALGLAIDGGGMFLLYRDVQNATDAAGLSAAYSLCSGGDPELAVLQSAELNGFIDGTDGVTITIENPPTANLLDPSSPYINDIEYVAIEILAVKPSYFIQVVYDGPLDVRGVTVAQCAGADNFGFPDDAALVQLNVNECNGSGQETLKQKGNSSVAVFGNVYINHDSVACDAVDILGPSQSHFYIDGKLCAQGTVSIGGSEGVLNPYTGLPAEVEADCDDVPQLTGNAAQDPLRLRGNEPSCGPARGSLNTYAGGVAQPGTYSNFTLNPGIAVDLAPGIYCVTGDSSMKGDLTSQAGGVTIYMDCDSCEFDVTAQSNVDITAQSSGPYANLLFYSRAVGATNKWNGGANMHITGTVYSPRSACSLQGDANTAIYAQLICHTFDIEGGGEIRIYFDPATIYQVPPSFGITQ